jgi:hypothetical protein
MAAPSPRPISERPQPQRSPLIISGLIALAGLVIFTLALKWTGFTMNVSVTNLANLLAPVAFAAAVVERAVEILISPWRDAGASKLKKALAAIQARPAGGAKEADEQNASNALDEYQGETQKYAFAASLLLSLCVSISGVRALQPFLADQTFKNADGAQKVFFLTVDAALTALLLCGGADGVHSVINAVTTFFDSSAAKSERAAAN